MRILITGGAGFVGSHLARAMVRSGHSVVVVDNLVTAHSLELLRGIRQSVEFHHGDIRCREDLQRLPRGPYDRVYHLAASYANALSLEDPLLDLRTNVEGTLNVLDFARRAGVGLFVYTGSSASYGDAPLPLREDGPMRPQTPYAVHKQVGEWHVRASGLAHAVFRLFNVYGPGDPPGAYRNAIPNMLVAAGAGDERIRLYGADATRDFNYVDDVIQILSDPDRAAGQTVNIGSGVETRVADVARVIVQLLDLPEEKISIEAPRGWDRIARRAASVERLESLYGKRTPMRLEEGLRRTALALAESGVLRRRVV